MDCTNSMSRMNQFARHFQELVPQALCQYESANDVETVYECERMMALPDYKQLPINEQSAIADRRQQILRNWQFGASVPSDDSAEPHDDRLLRHKLNRLQSLWANHEGRPLPEQESDEIRTALMN
jgi:hypothetical protein